MIVNLTQHAATKEQLDAGVVELSQEQKKGLAALLTFTSCPTKKEVSERAIAIAAVAAEFVGNDFNSSAMIGGAPFLMSALEKALLGQGITAVYAFSERVSVEEHRDGAVVKTNVFRHVGFVEA